MQEATLHAKQAVGAARDKVKQNLEELKVRAVHRVLAAAHVHKPSVVAGHPGTAAVGTRGQAGRPRRKRASAGAPHQRHTALNDGKRRGGRP